MSTAESLADHKAWLESIGSKPCICRFEWKPLSRDFGSGWVRSSTEPDCQEHGKQADL